MAKKTSGPPPFMAELCKLLGVEDNTKKAGPDAAPAKNPCAELELKLSDVEPKSHKLKAKWTVDPKSMFGPHEGIYAESPLEEENQKILTELVELKPYDLPITKILEENSLKELPGIGIGNLKAVAKLAFSAPGQQVVDQSYAHKIDPEKLGKFYVSGKQTFEGKFQDAKLVAQVHDELIYEMPTPEQVEDVKKQWAEAFPDVAAWMEMANKGKEEAVSNKCNICGSLVCSHLGAPPQMGITKTHPAVKTFKLLAKKLKFLKAYSGLPEQEAIIKNQMQVLAEKYLPIGAAHKLVEQAENELVSQAKQQPGLLSNGLEAAFKEMEKWQGAELAEPTKPGIAPPKQPLFSTIDYAPLEEKFLANMDFSLKEAVAGYLGIDFAKTQDETVFKQEILGTPWHAGDGSGSKSGQITSGPHPQTLPKPVHCPECAAKGLPAIPAQPCEHMKVKFVDHLGELKVPPTPDKVMKGSHYEIPFYKVSSEKFAKEPAGKIGKLSGPKEKELILAKTQLALVEELIAKQQALIPDANSSFSMESLHQAKQGWQKKIAVLKVEVENEKIANLKAMAADFIPLTFLTTEPVPSKGTDTGEDFSVGSGTQQLMDTVEEQLKQAMATSLNEKLTQEKVVELKAKAMEVLQGFKTQPAPAEHTEPFTQARMMKLQIEAIRMLAKGVDPNFIASHLTERTPVCCPYATVDDCETQDALKSYFDLLKVVHFEQKHEEPAKVISHLNLKAMIGYAAILARSPSAGPGPALTWFNERLPSGIPWMVAQTLETPEAVEAYVDEVVPLLLDLQEENPEYDESEGVTVVELTLTNLTPEEANLIMKTLSKTQTKKDILVNKTTRKEMGTKSKAIVVWPFESSSMQVNNEPILYKTQLNEDGTLSCNCAGWCMGSAKNKGGRFCKHTKAVQIEAELIYKKWKKGEPLGENFEVAPASIQEASSKTLFKALKLKPEKGEATIFKAKRIVEI